MRLLLVRHGESICSVKGIVGGARGCTGLTERGFAQARALRDRFAVEALEPDVLMSSTLPRAVETADVAAEAIGLDAIRDPELCEHRPGEIDGTSWDNWERFDLLAEPDRPFSPGGESWRGFRARVGGVLERLASLYADKTVVAVCHGGVVFASRFVLLGDDQPDPCDFTSITEWKYDGGDWTLVRFADASHLEGTDLIATT